MKRFVKFIWGASGTIRGRWYLGLIGIYDRQGFRGNGLAISVRGLLLWHGALGVVADVAAAVMLFTLWDRNPHSFLSFQDALLYPVRRPLIAQKHGQAFIAQGLDLFRAQKYHDAANLLRLGLARYPHDLTARLKLAQYYELINQREIALRTLTEGLTDELPGRAYLQTLFDSAERAENHDLIIGLGNRYLATLPSNDASGTRHWLLRRTVTAQLAAGRPADALARAESEPAGDTTREYRVLALLALNRADDAIALLADWRRQPGADWTTVARLEVRAFRQAARFDAMEQALTELRARTPADPAPHVYGIVQQAMAGRDAAAFRLYEDFLFRFGGSASNLLLLAEPLAEIGHLALLKKCIAAAKERGYPLARFSVLRVQTLVQRGDWKTAAPVLAQLPPETGREAAAGKIWRTWMQHLIDAMGNQTSNAPQVLLELLRTHRWTMEVFRRTTEALLLAGQLEVAQDVIALGLRSFPASSWLQAQATQVAADLALRRTASPEGANDTATPFVFVEQRMVDRLDELLRRRAWDEAGRLIREVRALRPAPSWLPARESSLHLAQLRVYEGQGNQVGVISSAQAYLNGDDNRARTLLDTAESFDAKGDRRTAIALAREILRRSPQHTPTQRALAAWQPVAAEKSPAPAKKPKS